MPLTGNETEFVGDYGWAKRLTIPDDNPLKSESVCSWLVYAPHSHPIWPFHTLDIIRLREVEGMPPPALKFDGANHEICVLSLNPEENPYTVDKMHGFLHGGGVPFLLPPDVSEQFECSDEEANLLGTYAAWGCTVGHLVPDSDYRSVWLPALVKTLAHIRGEEHAH